MQWFGTTPAFLRHRHYHHNVTDEVAWTKGDEVTKVILGRIAQDMNRRAKIGRVFLCDLR